MSVRAKFYVHSITRFAGGSSEIVAKPVARGDANKDWSKWTPSGELRFGTLNDRATAFFEALLTRTEGRPEFYLTMEACPVDDTDE